MAVRAQTHHTKRGGVARKGGEKSSFRVLSPLLVVVFVREEVVLLWGFLVEIYHEQASLGRMLCHQMAKEGRCVM